MYDHTFLNLKITSQDIRPQIKCIINLVIAYGRFNLPQGFVWYVWVNTLDFITPEGHSRMNQQIVPTSVYQQIVPTSVYLPTARN